MTLAAPARRRFAAGLACFLAAAFGTAGAVGTAAEPPAVEWPATDERAAVEAIAAQFDEVEKVERNADGTLKSVAFRGRGAKDKASFSLRFDPDSQKVVQVSGNVVGVKNDEYGMFAPLSALENLTLWHNSCDCPRDQQAILCDGAGLTALKGNAALETITLAGGPLDNDGLAAIVKLPQVQRLRIWHIAADDAGFAALRNHPGLRAVRVGPTWNPTITDATIEHLSTCPNMTELAYGEGYLTWDRGLRHLTRLKGTLQTLDLGNALVAPEDIERVRDAMPDVTVKHDGLAAVGALIARNDRKSADRLPNWGAPQELIDRYLAAAADRPATEPPATK